MIDVIKNSSVFRGILSSYLLIGLLMLHQWLKHDWQRHQPIPTETSQYDMLHLRSILLVNLRSRFIPGSNVNVTQYLAFFSLNYLTIRQTLTSLTQLWRPSNSSTRVDQTVCRNMSECWFYHTTKRRPCHDSLARDLAHHLDLAADLQVSCFKLLFLALLCRNVLNVKFNLAVLIVVKKS